MKRRPLLAFFALTFGLTWGLGACFALFPAQLTAVFGKLSVANPLFILAVYAPGISAIVVTASIDGAAGTRRLLGGFLRWRIGIQWYLAILVGIPMLSAIAMLLDATLARNPLSLDHWYQMFLLGPSGHKIADAAYAGGLWRAVPIILGSFLADPGPLGEELGWRGFALPRLLKDRSALSAGVILGIIWGMWHLPAFLLGGTPQNNMSFPLFMIGVVALSVLMTWAFKGTRGSVLAAALIHWTFNTCSDMSQMPLALFSVGVIVIAAAVVVAVAGPGLSRSSAYDESSLRGNKRLVANLAAARVLVMAA
jgi:membrane protease YdiL (CAAX protease family)